MMSFPMTTGRVVGATAAAILPMACDQTPTGEPTGTSRPSPIAQCEARGVIVGIPPVRMDVAGWFRPRMPIPGTDAFVTFKRQPPLTLHIGDAVYIDEWGVRIPLDEIVPEKIQNRVVGQYLRLAERARRQRLTPKERAYWETMVTDSDYSDFCQRTAPMAALGGVRVRAIANAVEVLWDGAEPEMLHGDFARQLAVVDDGEAFSARGRFVNDSLTALSDVVPLGKPTPVDLDDLFGKV